MSFIRRYDADWPRLLDFVTPLNLQQNLDPSLELTYYKAWVSVPMSKLTGQMHSVTTGLGISIEQDHISRRRTNVTFGSVDQTQVRLTQRELWNNVLKNTIIEEVPTVVGRQRAILEPVPPKLESTPIFDGCEEIYRLERSHAHLTNIIRRRMRLPVANPCAIVRNDLTLHGYVNYNDPIFRRMRSIWVTDWMMATPVKGWSDLGVQGVADASYALSRDKFHQDVGIPQQLEGTVDHSLFEWQLYRLLKRGQFVAMGIET